MTEAAEPYETSVHILLDRTPTRLRRQQTSEPTSCEILGSHSGRVEDVTSFREADVYRPFERL
jgi:hypothetical protein